MTAARSTSAREVQAPDPALTARFRRDCEALGAGAGTRLALAVSGGPDSMAMLVLAAAAFPGRSIAATVDHGLRPEAAHEAAMVATFCATLEVPHATLTVEAPIAGASIQAQARAARYARLLHWARDGGAGALLTAHHADDQAETFLMRAARGSGVAGLAGIRARRRIAGEADRDVPLLRPLLDWRRAALRAVAEAAGAPFVDDPSNADEAYDRTRFRRLLERNPELDVVALAASATHAAEAERTLAEIADREWLGRRRWDAPGVAFAAAGLPRDLLRRLARHAIDTVRGDAGITTPAWSDAVNIEPLLDALSAGRGATQAGVMARATGDCWHFRPAPARRSH